jgi:hypothetical protein
LLECSLEFRRESGVIAKGSPETRIMQARVFDVVKLLKEDDRRALSKFNGFGEKGDRFDEKEISFHGLDAGGSSGKNARHSNENTAEAVFVLDIASVVEGDVEYRV